MDPLKGSGTVSRCLPPTLPFMHGLELLPIATIYLDEEHEVVATFNWVCNFIAAFRADELICFQLSLRVGSVGNLDAFLQNYP
uniref:Uncharacterized protein n=1 Tax=Moniliophthora roreri TaxID=221103 RepID=A0A0W0F5C5_MONRR